MALLDIVTNPGETSFILEENRGNIGVIAEIDVNQSSASVLELPSASVEKSFTFTG